MYLAVLTNLREQKILTINKIGVYKYLCTYFGISNCPKWLHIFGWNGLKPDERNQHFYYTSIYLCRCIQYISYCRNLWRQTCTNAFSLYRISISVVTLTSLLYKIFSISLNLSCSLRHVQFISIFNFSQYLSCSLHHVLLRARSKSWTRFSVDNFLLI